MSEVECSADLGCRNGGNPLIASRPQQHGHSQMGRNWSHRIRALLATISGFRTRFLVERAWNPCHIISRKRQRVAFSNLRDLRELAMPCHEPFLYLVGGLEPWNFMTFHVLGIIISSSQLTKSIIFKRGRYTLW